MVENINVKELKETVVEKDLHVQYSTTEACLWGQVFLKLWGSVYNGTQKQVGTDKLQNGALWLNLCCVTVWVDFNSACWGSDLSLCVMWDTEWCETVSL